MNVFANKSFHVGFYKKILHRFKSTNAAYADTLNLPKAGNFNLSMKNIYENEENIKKSCNFESLYKWQEADRASSDTFILHDGPPYANGDLHMGHMVNKVLKDVYLRYKLLAGSKINYIPGWDCHGLPIELNALKNIKNLNKEKQDLNFQPQNSKLETRKMAGSFAKKYIQIQMDSFKKLNLISDWSTIYRTIDPNYMCSEIDLFYELYKRKLIFRDYMPVYWSMSSKTALAEFELEYNMNHKSNCVYVEFEIKHLIESIKAFLKPNHKLFGLIWTTTPWSLPGNQAIAFNPNLKYNLVCVDDSKVYILADDLTRVLIDKIPKFSTSSIQILASINGTDLANLKYYNPFTFDDAPFLASDHVTPKQGTGLVHIAPAFGHDDFKLALKNGLKTTCVIDENGFYNKNDKNLINLNLNGKNAFDEDINKRIESILNGNILYKHEHIHSYPYDWRTKKPVIIRSSQQWFINTDKLKERALEVLKDVKIRPSNVANSMVTTLANRPYWCISRQRVWGLPIPCFYNTADDLTPIINDDLISNFKKFIKSDGNVDFWWTNKYDKELNVSQYKKSNDIFDIWFDSGSSFNSVLKGQQADLYCEGVDQFSGWFQASLLLSVALNDRAPYKSLLVHGFVVDEQNRKMSKSLGNIIEPMQALKGFPKKKIPQCGNDVLRFWVLSEYHKSHIAIGSDILQKFFKRVFEIRSIIRFLVANIYDFDASRDMVDYESLLEPDKYLLHKLNSIVKSSVENYEDMNLNKILIPLETFLLVDVSAFYIKSLKDRLYCEHKSSFSRKCAQNVLLHTLEKVLTILAPVMPHLTEEAYKNSILNKTDSIFQSHLSFKKLDNPKWNNEMINNKFEILNSVRDSVNLIISTNNPALYEVKIKFDNNLVSLLGKDFNKNKWLSDFLGCANVTAVFVDLSNEQAKVVSLNSVDYKYLVDVSQVQNKFACPRCRRFINTTNDCLCDRCAQVMQKI